MKSIKEQYMDKAQEVLERPAPNENRDKKGRFKKGMKAWNFQGGRKLKRKYKRFKGKLMLNARVVWLKYKILDKIPEGYIIHHKDGDSLNDDIENLILMSDTNHKSLHNKKAGDALIHSPLTGRNGEKDTPDDSLKNRSGIVTGHSSSGTHSQDGQEGSKSSDRDDSGKSLSFSSSTSGDHGKIWDAKDDWTTDKIGCTNSEEKQ